MKANIAYYNKTLRRAVEEEVLVPVVGKRETYCANPKLSGEGMVDELARVIFNLTRASGYIDQALVELDRFECPMFQVAFEDE